MYLYMLHTYIRVLYTHTRARASSCHIVRGHSRKDENMECEEWLKEQLKSGHSIICDDVRTAAKMLGFTSQRLKTARKKLEVKTFHQFDEDGATPNWFWYLEGE